MTTDSNLDAMYERLLATSREALAGGLYEVAYYALMAAMHCAEALGDEARLHLPAPGVGVHRCELQAPLPLLGRASLSLPSPCLGERPSRSPPPAWESVPLAPLPASGRGWGRGLPARAMIAPAISDLFG